ncbi:hypothetical protein OIV83_003583 [Microbotryomycetes sp. JL201]|nr:hypothetical protein OIV83_003583 [Microbotryomycetes sp. JL201]
MATTSAPSSIVDDKTRASDHSDMTADVAQELELGLKSEIAADVPATPWTPPDGGWKAWSSVAGAWICSFLAFGWTNSWGTLQAYYTSTRYPNESPSTIAWVGSLQMFFIFVGGAVSGPLYDRGYFRQIMTVGSILYIVGFFMASLAQTFWQTLLAQGVCFGLGMSALFLPPIALLSQWFLKRRALAMGIAVVGSSVGGIVFPIFLGHLLDHHDFGTALRAPAYLCLGLLILANLIMHENPTRPRRPTNAVLNVRQFARDPPYVLAVCGAFFTSLGVFYANVFLPVFTEQKQLPHAVSFYSLAILNAASIFGRTCPNYLADLFGPMNALIPMCAMNCVLIWAMFGADSTGGAIAFAILYGFSSGAYVSLITPVLVTMSKSPTEIGARSGIAFVFVGFAALIGTPISGALLRRTPSFVAPICWSGGVLAVGTMFFIFSRFQQVKTKGTWRV